ncbi:polyhydroxyalkanoate depolymerase [Parvibium lacunae]|uniref:Polyhydroxyalkanoate depolymerase n=1 Tax=Parvibium lacunae TaxID=1888893 RepID=A0A368L486_9BURK|nr:polyhydroxyalkanoate depolymerase [Parvibium lacunae]RCS58293.1 polyhydroxyalkanoate depolymerase [Parvibium lacunae]
MLYQLHEIQRQMLNRVSSWAEMSAQLFSNPYSPLAYTPFSKRISAGYDLLHRLGKEYDKPAFGLTVTSVEGHEVAVNEEVVVAKPFCKLLHFARDLSATPLQSRAADPTVLLVAPLSGHHATLLRDTVRALLPEHDVYITDWVDARLVPLSAGEFHLDDYVHYVIEFLQLLGPNVHVISVCQPTVPVLAAVSLMAAANDPKLPLSMTMMGGPIDARRSPTAVNALAIKKPFSWFENNVIYTVPAKYPGYLRRVYPGFLQHAGFVAMNPDRHVQSHWDYYEHLMKGDDQSTDAHRAFYDEYNAVLDLPAEYYLETIRTVFQEYLLPEGRWHVRGERVAPESIRQVALFTIEGELDDISGSGQTRAAHDLCCNIPADHKQHLEVTGAGHYGIFSGRRWRTVVCPQIRDFIRQHEVRIGAAPKRANRRG